MTTEEQYVQRLAVLVVVSDVIVRLPLCRNVTTSHSVFVDIHSTDDDVTPLLSAEVSDSFHSEQRRRQGHVSEHRSHSSVSSRQPDSRAEGPARKLVSVLSNQCV